MPDCPQLIERSDLKEFHAILWTVQDCGKSTDNMGDWRNLGSKSDTAVDDAIAMILDDMEIWWNTSYLLIMKMTVYLELH